MKADTRTPLERWWDQVTKQKRTAMQERFLGMPSSLMTGVIYHKMGTAHPLNAAEPWMLWSKVHSRVTDLMTMRVTNQQDVP